MKKTRYHVNTGCFRNKDWNFKHQWGLWMVSWHGHSTGEWILFVKLKPETFKPVVNLPENAGNF